MDSALITSTQSCLVTGRKEQRHSHQTLTAAQIKQSELSERLFPLYLLAHFWEDGLQRRKNSNILPRCEEKNTAAKDDLCTLAPPPPPPSLSDYLPF